jgi:Domain of unknown function (DUF6430)
MARRVRQLLRAMRSVRTVRLWAATGLSALGLLAGVIGLVAALFPHAAEPYRWWYLSLVLLLSIVYGTVRAWPRQRYSRHFPVPDTQISIVVGDLFEQGTHTVIGMSDTFDTAIPDIISAHSIQGQFLTRVYEGNLERLDRELESALHGKTSVKLEIREDKPEGKLKRYAMGTVAVLGGAQQYYFCVAYSMMSNSNVAQSSVSDLWLGLSNLWDIIRDKGQRQPVSMPIVGSELARVSNQVSRADLVRLIILSFLTESRERVVTNELRIVVYPKDAEHLDLRELADFLAAL